MTILTGSVLANKRSVGGAEYCVCFVFLCTPFHHFLFSCNGPNGSDERQQGGGLKAVGCWFESGQCGGLKCQHRFFVDRHQSV